VMDLRTITFRQDHAIKLKKNSYYVFMCLRQTEENTSMLFVMSAMRNIKSTETIMGLCPKQK